MKVGDLVKPLESCAGELGHLRCDRALILEAYHSHNESIQVNSFEYMEVEVYEYKLLCGCGAWEEYEDRLEVLSESW
jgi:hypothetical protein